MLRLIWNESGRYNLIYLRHDWYIPYQHAAFQVSLGLEGMFAGLKIERGLQFSDNPMLIYHSGWDFWRFEQGLFSKNQQFLHALLCGSAFARAELGQDSGSRSSPLRRNVQVAGLRGSMAGALPPRPIAAGLLAGGNNSRRLLARSISH